jgi:hypothetical protein
MTAVNMIEGMLFAALAPDRTKYECMRSDIPPAVCEILMDSYKKVYLKEIAHDYAIEMHEFDQNTYVWTLDAVHVTPCLEKSRFIGSAIQYHADDGRLVMLPLTGMDPYAFTKKDDGIQMEIMLYWHLPPPYWYRPVARFGVYAPTPDGKQVYAFTLDCTHVSVFTFAKTSEGKTRMNHTKPVITYNAPKVILTDYNHCNTVLATNDGIVYLFLGLIGMAETPVYEHSPCDVFRRYIHKEQEFEEIAKPPFRAMSKFACALMADGNVIVTGGQDIESRSTNACWVYNPKANKWEQLPSMLNARAYHTICRLHNGNIMVIGGDDGDGAVRVRCEIFDVVNRVWFRIDDCPLKSRKRLIATTYN